MDKTSAYLLGVLGIVAVVAVAVLLMNNEASADFSGQAIKISKVSKPSFGAFTKYPDLIITGINSIYINGTTLNETRVNFTIKNQGRGDPYDNGKRVVWVSGEQTYLTIDGISEVGWGGPDYSSLSSTSLDPGSSMTMKLLFDLDTDVINAINGGTSWDLEVTLEVDEWNLITESDETNNEYTTTVTLTAADIVS